MDLIAPLASVVKGNEKGFDPLFLLRLGRGDLNLEFFNPLASGVRCRVNEGNEGF